MSALIHNLHRRLVDSDDRQVARHLTTGFTFRVILPARVLDGSVVLDPTQLEMTLVEEGSRVLWPLVRAKESDRWLFYDELRWNA